MKRVELNRCIKICQKMVKSAHLAIWTAQKTLIVMLLSVRTCQLYNRYAKPNLSRYQTIYLVSRKPTSMDQSSKNIVPSERDLRWPLVANSRQSIIINRQLSNQHSIFAVILRHGELHGVVNDWKKNCSHSEILNDHCQLLWM